MSSYLGSSAARQQPFVERCFHGTPGKIGTKQRRYNQRALFSQMANVERLCFLCKVLKWKENAKQLLLTAPCAPAVRISTHSSDTGLHGSQKSSRLNASALQNSFIRRRERRGEVAVFCDEQQFWCDGVTILDECSYSAPPYRTSLSRTNHNVHITQKRFFFYRGASNQTRDGAKPW